MIVTIDCRICGEPSLIEVASLDIAKWKAGTFIQNAMPYLTADEREMFISGTCGKCWDEMFPEEEEFADLSVDN